MNWKKIFSGQFWLAIGAGFVFVVCSLGIPFWGCTPVALTKDQIVSVILVVYAFYFNRKKDIE